MIPQAFEMIRGDFARMLAEFHQSVIDSESAWEVVVTSASGWMMRVDFDMASGGGLIGIDWIESPQGERREVAQMDDWHSGCCHGFIAAVAEADRKARQ
jgi:hypothetical protein